MAFPSDYWRSYEHTIQSLPAFQKAVRRISAYERATGSKFVWRGVANARHPLYSSIVRAYKDRNGLVPTENNYVSSS